MNEKCKSTCQSSNVKSSVVNLTLLYIRSEVVIPAKAGIQLRNNGLRVKPGMTNKGKRFLTHHTIYQISKSS
jgi:hypothetical protein